MKTISEALRIVLDPKYHFKKKKEASFLSWFLIVLDVIFLNIEQKLSSLDQGEGGLYGFINDKFPWFSWKTISGAFRIVLDP